MIITNVHVYDAMDEVERLQHELNAPKYSWRQRKEIISKIEILNLFIREFIDQIPENSEFDRSISRNLKK